MRILGRVRFVGGTFTPGLAVDSDYIFDRAAAHVALESSVGVVSPLSASVEYAIAPRWTALVEFDGLVSPSRAIDEAAKIGNDLSDACVVTAGYRGFEEGVDDERCACG